MSALLMVACNNSTVYTIEGTLEGAEGTIALTNLRGQTIVEAELVDGAFKLVHESETPFPGYLRLGEDKFLAAVYADEVKDINVSGSVEEPVVEGGVATAAANSWMTFQNGLVARIQAGEPQEPIYAEYEQMIDKYREENKDNLYGIMQFINNALYEMEPQEVIDQIAALPERYQKMEETQSVVERAEAMLKVAVGKPCVEIVAPDVDGNEVKLSDVYKANKYTLIDFWASWCGPCMGEVPYLLEDYAKYHPLGFEIYGLSLDSNREAWVNAINTKGLGWINVSRVNGWDEPAVNDYAVTGIPSNFLVDSEGIIVARDLRGEALGAKLEELLK